MKDDDNNDDYENCDDGLECPFFSEDIIKENMSSLAGNDCKQKCF